MKQSLIGALCSFPALLLVPGVAAAHPTYMECDNARSADYPTVAVHPKLCNLGLQASDYDVQPVGSRAFGTIGLRRLRWRGWGRSEATAYGLACNLYSDGIARWSQCANVVVRVYHPMSIAPAGGASIYQLTRVTHSGSSSSRWQAFTFWYQPGLDY